MTMPFIRRAVLAAACSAACTSPSAQADPAPVSPAPAPAAAPDTDGAGTPITAAFPPPGAAERVDADAFGTWLGGRTLAAADRPVRTHDGRTVGHRARVVELPIVRGDLQQCADSAIRLRAEWQREQGLSPSFKATSGDDIPWSRYAAGERATAQGNRLVWSAGGAGTWESWLRTVFMYAGTRSLEAYETVPATEPRPGDVLVEGGSPGHAVVLLDVARDPTSGQIWLLVGEGFMPAQDFHVELGPEDGWWPWSEAEGLALPHWPMGPDSLRRWK